MKFAVAKEHRDFFQQQGLIEFTDFLNPDQLARVNLAINEAIAKRTESTPEKWRHLSSEQLFLNGRDLWRVNDDLRKWTTQPRFAEIAFELVEKKPIRLGYDQLFSAISQTTRIGKSGYSQFIRQTTNLEEISCLKGILCGLMLCLSSPDNEETMQIEGLDIFPKQCGNAIFFQPQANFNLENLIRHVGQRFYLIVYTQQLAQYQLQPGDLHTHALKHLGYIFNDKLSDKLNPIVYR